MIEVEEVSRTRRIKAPRSATSAKPSHDRTLFALCGLLILAAVLCYANTFSVPFLFDDQSRIEENTAIRQLWPLAIPMENTNRPFGMYTFAINYALHGYRVWGYHATNLAVHILAGLTLFGIARRTLLQSRFAGKYHNSATWLAFAIALVWLVHPLNTQAVTYIVQRLESLMGLCYLATLYCFIRAQDSPRRTLWYAVSIACCAVGMGIKEVMVTAPLMVVWYHRAFVAQSWQAVFRDHWRYYLGLFSTWIILAWCMLRTKVEYSSGSLVFVEGVTPLGYLFTQAGVITHYLRLSFWPVGQCLDYGWPIAQTPREIIPPLLFIGSLVGATIWAIFRHPAWGFLGGWFFVILSPTSSFVPIIDLAFEQRMYLPLAAVVALTIIAGYLVLQSVLGKVASLRSSNWMSANQVGTALAVAVAIVLSMSTYQRNKVYASEDSIWKDVIVKRPNDARAHVNLGMVLHERGEFDSAVARYQEAIRLKPTLAEAYYNLGTTLLHQNKFDLGIEQLSKAIRLKPGFAQAHYNLALALQSQGKIQLAIEPYREAIRLMPNVAEIHNNLGIALYAQGKLDQAIAQYHEAIRLNPGYAEAHSNLGGALLRQGKFDQAVDECRKAIRLNPNYAAAYNNLGKVLQRQGKLDLAIEQYCEAIRLMPDFPKAYYNRSVAHYKLGKYDQAWADLGICRKLGISPSPTYVKALIAASGRPE